MLAEVVTDWPIRVQPAVELLGVLLAHDVGLVAAECSIVTIRLFSLCGLERAVPDLSLVHVPGGLGNSLELDAGYSR